MYNYDDEFKKFKEQQPKSYSSKCFVSYCNKPGEYLVGDVRFTCSMCEEHSGIRRQFECECWKRMERRNKIEEALKKYGKIRK